MNFMVIIYISTILQNISFLLDKQTKIKTYYKSKLNHELPGAGHEIKREAKHSSAPFNETRSVSLNQVNVMMNNVLCINALYIIPFNFK